MSRESLARELYPISEEEEGEIDPELEKALDLHIFDIEPKKVGSRELIGKLGDSMVGAANCEIERAHPSIDIEEFRLESGKSVVMIGPNGAGKSTVLDAVMQRYNAGFSTKEGKGAVVYGNPFHQREELRIARLDQEEILQKIGGMNVRDVIDQTAEYFKAQFSTDWEDPDPEVYDRNMANTEAQQRIEELASRMIKFFNMEEFLDRDVSELSGGERTKLVLFSILASEPDVLLLDEPTNHLDMESIAKLTGLFEKYKKAGASLISVSHVDWFLEETGNDGVVEIEATEKGAKLIESGSPYKKYIKSREGIEVVKEPISWEKSPARRTGQTIVSVADKLSIECSPIKEADFPSIQSGEVVILSGRNGTGKTRIMEAISGRRGKSFSKEKGVNIAYVSQFWPDEVAQGSLENFFQWVKQETSPLCDVTSKQYVTSLRKSGFGSSQEDLRIDETLLQKPLNTFSGGEQRLLWFLAVSNLPKVDMLLLDEPTNHMDRKLQGVITKAIQGFPGAVVLASHDVRLIEALTDDVGNKSVITPKHLVLEKRGDKTSITVSQEKPSDYALEVRQKAKKEAKRFKM